MLNFCTLFDSLYLLKGMALYESLIANCNNFHLFIFAFDDICFEYLKEQNLKCVSLISLQELEDEELLKIKDSRTIGEYCWSSKPSALLYVLKKFNLPACTYLDSDIFFFSNPSVLIDEIDKQSVLITPHWYSDENLNLLESGIYCAHFLTFKNDNNGMKVLKWWHNACIDWCYNRHEAGKYGDQKYLDDWIEKFEGVHVLQNVGGGLAPWNISQYEFYKSNNVLYGENVANKQKFTAVFFHFHGLKILGKNKYDLSGYRLNKDVIKYLYQPYIHTLRDIINKNKNMDIDLYEISKGKKRNYLSRIKNYILRRINKNYNIIET